MVKPYGVKRLLEPEDRECSVCGADINHPLSAQGRVARFCSTKCRVAAHRAKKNHVDGKISKTDLLSFLAWVRQDFKDCKREMDALEELVKRHG